MSHVEGSATSRGAGAPQTAARPRFTDILFDLRTVIGALFAVYGLVCAVWGITSFTDADSRRTGGVNLNLWAGLGMLAVAASFLVWSIRKPVLPVTANTPDGAGTDADGGSAGSH